MVDTTAERSDPLRPLRPLTGFTLKGSGVEGRMQTVRRVDTAAKRFVTLLSHSTSVPEWNDVTRRVTTDLATNVLLKLKAAAAWCRAMSQRDQQHMGAEAEGCSSLMLCNEPTRPTQMVAEAEGCSSLMLCNEPNETNSRWLLKLKAAAAWCRAMSQRDQQHMGAEAEGCSSLMLCNEPTRPTQMVAEAEGCSSFSFDTLCSV